MIGNYISQCLSNVVSLYIQVKHWFISIVHVIFTCTATKILYVLPDNVSDVNCPSQPCATLGQYLLDNGSLPVLSDVEYYFLPGEHHVVNVINVVRSFNCSLIGFGSSPAKLVCQSQSSVNLYYSYNVTIRNLVFSQYSYDVISEFGFGVDASLFIYDCSHCKVENIWSFGYGFAGVNMFLNSSINNVTINLSVVMPIIKMCSPKFLLAFVDTKSDHYHDSIFIHNVLISGFNEICYNKRHEAMDIFLYQKHFSITVELHDSLFHNMDQTALNIHMIFFNASSSLLIKNCSFRYIKHVAKILNGLVSKNAAVQFENCAFYNNTASRIIDIQFTDNDKLCMFPNIITIKNCNFSDNYGTVLKLSSRLDCNKIIFFHDNVTFARNEGDDVMYFTHISVYMNGTITILKNIAAHRIIVFDICNIIFSKLITFISNKCINIVHLRSHELPYIY